jgi:hypothetical protein
MASHPDIELSAYLDESLSNEERAAVRAHLAGCLACREDLESLRAVRGLVAALPTLAPRRSLVPRARVPAWLVPARWVSTVAAAAFAFVFVVSSVGGAPRFTSTGAALPASSPQASVSAYAPLQESAKAAPTPTPQPAPAFFTSAAPRDLASNERASAQPRGQSASDRNAAEQPAGLPSWTWLVAAIVAAAIALALQWRLVRRT